jgi:carboxypeptidase Taq
MANTVEMLSELRERLLVIGHLGGAASLLAWDQATYIPPHGHAGRGDQQATLARLAHQHTTDPALVALLETLAQARLSDEDAALVRTAKRVSDRAVRVPAALVAEIARQRVRSRQVWERARSEDDFASFAPELAKTIALQRDLAANLNPHADAYDVLHDLYEIGSSAAAVAALFDPLKLELSALLREIVASPQQPDASILERSYPEAQQEAFAKAAAAELGYDFGRGRLDRTAHPFCIGIAPGDVRITTRYLERFLPSALFGTLHEAGHGIYEQNLPPEHANTPLGEAISLAVHESQSRLYENLIARNPAYWERKYKELQAAFPGVLAEVSRSAFVHAINVVRPSLIRVEADEVSYHLHVMLRFDLERALMSGSLSVADLPGAWRELHQQLLGVAPHDDRDGCLQDVHWSEGMIGYFPTYTLGTLMSVQWWEAMEGELGDLDALLRAGEFSPITGWLTEHVHAHGSRFDPPELLARATGKPLDYRPLLRYLRRKYGALYALA